MDLPRVKSRLARLTLLALIVCSSAGVASSADRHLEARLIWGTNDDKSPNPSHKRLEGDLAKKLQELPFKWKSYFEVNRQTFTINDKEYKKVVMSDKCFIEVKDKGDSKVTVKLYGQGKMTQRVDKPLPKDETLAIGGDDKHDTAWFVTVRPVEAPPSKPAPNAAAKK